MSRDWVHIDNDEVSSLSLLSRSTKSPISWLSPYFNAPIYVASNALPSNIASYSIAILQTGSFLGRALSGILADLFGVWNMYVTMGLASGISIFAFWCPQPIPTAVAIIGLLSYGFASGAWITLVAASCGAISPTREFGMRLGMLWSLSSLGALAGPVICGGEARSPQYL
jgi:MCP family monocarboxylic acid transporter-like MFS transporter 10